MGFQSICRFGRRAMPLALAVLVAVPFASKVFAAAVEEVVVTAQRTEESIQDVPIAVSAFTGTMLEDKQIISPSDLQMNAPNVSFSATNFGSSSFSIRGIGRLVVSASGDSGVSFHVNEIALPTNLPALEFYDMQRVEVLRGPQGTLYGRNATGGVVDMITNKPSTEAVSGNLDLEYGNYNSQRAKGALNIPITDTFAIRVAGIRLQRDGYIENTANGQIGCASQTGFNYTDPTTGNPIPCQPQTLPGIHSHMDGRDMYSFRITGLWNPTENSSAWIMYSKFYENDDKVRITNQVCQSNPLPVTGCTPNGFGFDAPSNSATTGGMFVGLNGGFLLGLQNPQSGYPVPSTGFRKQHTDFQPVYKYNEEAWEFNYQYNFNKYSVILDGGYLTSSYLSQQDYNVDVGYNIATTAFGGPQDTYPTSQPAGFASKDWTSGKCNFDAGTSGLFGGCVYPTDGTRGFAYDQSDSEGTYWTAEGRLQSSFDGFFNFMVGVNYAKSQYNGDYYVIANSLDLVGTYGVPQLGFPALYPTMFDATGAPNGGTEGDSWAYFGEAYFQVTDKFKITAGLRYNDDTKQVQDSSILYNSFVVGANPNGGVLAVRSDLAPFLTDSTNMYLCLTGAQACTGAQTSAIDLGNLYGTTDAWLAAVNAGDPAAAFAATLLTPPAPGFNEQRTLTGSPKKADWQETTGRIGFDWNILDDTMVYGFYTRGYKPGGFNPPLNAAFVNSGTAAYTFAPEKVDAYEVGSKSTFFDGGMTFNTAFFYYKYKDLQVSRIANNTSVNGNMDADIYGAEVEAFYVPDFLPNLTIDFAYSYLHTEIVNSSAVDPLDRGAGDPNFITLKNIDPGSLTGVSYVADVTQITPALVQQAYAECGALASAADGNGNATCTSWANGVTSPVIPVADGTVYTGAVNPAYAGIPAYFSQGFLNANGVTTSDGFNTDLDGNQLPSSPKNTVHVGAAYAISTSWGTFTPRVDYYWQGEMYAREFNTKGDYIDSWDQWNASLLYTSTDGRWEAKAWIRNIQDEDNITGKYLTSDTSGFFRNYFLTEPRVYGASVKYSFGAMN